MLTRNNALSNKQIAAMRMIEVFKTNVQEREQAGKLLTLLQLHFPSSKINFDLDDCDKILRVEGQDFVTEDIMRLVALEGFACTILE